MVRAIQSEILRWPSWWASRTKKQKTLPLLLILAYWVTLAVLHGFRSDHLTTGLVILAGCYGGPFLNAIFRFLLPVLLTAIIYDSQRFYSDYIRGPVHVQEPYHFDRFFFGINTPQGRLTPNEWWQLHTHPVLDVITGFYYLTFVPMFVCVAAYFQFWLPKKGTARLSGVEISRRAPRLLWSFFWVNVIGYTTYYWYAAAPPWYVALHGLGPARMDTLANAAGCVRFDAVLGTKFFTEWYGRSADVFGAIPSLHVAYPLQAVYFSWKFGSLKKFNLSFYLIMCFSAVYLNHHYILDIVLGSLYAVVITIMTDRYFEARESLKLKVSAREGSSLETVPITEKR